MWVMFSAINWVVCHSCLGDEVKVMMLKTVRGLRKFYYRVEYFYKGPTPAKIMVIVLKARYGAQRVFIVGLNNLIDRTGSIPAPLSDTN